MPLADVARRYFDAIAGRYERSYALTGETSRARIKAMLRELPERARVLELGVGTGRVLSALLDAGHQPVGLDISPNMLARAANRSRPVELVCADLYGQLPFADASFDAALALHGTLAHPVDDAGVGALVRELARVLSPGGVVVIEVPTWRWLDVAPRGEAGEVARTGDRTARYVDEATGAEIDVNLYSAEEWVAFFGNGFAVSSHDLGSGEIRLVARRR